MILLLKFHRVYRSVLLNWEGGNTRKTREHRVLQHQKKTVWKIWCRRPESPNDQKQRLKASLCVTVPRPESKRTSNDICHFTVTCPQSFQPAAGAPIKQVDKEGIPRAGPACVVSYLILDGMLRAQEARPEPGSCQPSGRQTPQGGNQEAAGLRGKLCSNGLGPRVSFVESGFQFKSKLKTPVQQTTVLCT